MPYNDTSQEFLNTLTKYNCPKRWIDEAKAYQENPKIATSEDMEKLYNHILTHILNEERTTDSVKTEARVFDAPKEEKKEEDNIEDEIDVRVHAKVADDYGDMKSDEEE